MLQQLLQRSDMNSMGEIEARVTSPQRQCLRNMAIRRKISNSLWICLKQKEDIHVPNIKK